MKSNYSNARLMVLKGRMGAWSLISWAVAKQLAAVSLSSSSVYKQLRYDGGFWGCPHSTVPRRWDPLWWSKRSQDPIEFDPSPTSNHWDQLRLTPIQYFYSLWRLRGPFSQFSEIRKLSQLKDRILQKSGLLMQQKLAGLASDYLNINHASIPYNYALQMRWLTSMTRPR